MTRISVIIPVFNNADTIIEVFAQLRSVLTSLSCTFELIAVDDGSSDASWRLIADESESDPRIRGLRLSRNFGQHAAITAALEESCGDVIVLIDADLEDDARDLPNLLAPVLEDRADLAIALNSGRDGKRTRASSKAFHRAFSRLSGTDVPANVNTFRVFNRRVADALLEYRERGVVYGPLMSMIGFRVEYVGVRFGSSRRGASSYTFRRRWRIAMDSMLSYSDIPYRAVMWMGLALSVISSLFLVVFILQYFLVGVQLVGGLGVVVAMLALFTGITMLSMSALFAYLIRVFREVLDRPRFHVMATSGEGIASRRKS